MKKNYTINLTFTSQEGLVARIALVLERRSYHITSLQITELNDQYAQMQISICGMEDRFEQICKQLQKLVNIVSLEVKESSTIKLEAVAA